MVTKVCKKCLIEKSIDGFYVEKRNKSGVMGSCKDCYNIITKTYRDNNTDKVKERSKKYYKNNIDKVKEIHKKYKENNYNEILVKQRKFREKNRKEINEKLKLWKSNNRERVLAQNKKYREKNKEKVKEYRSKYRIENIVKINDNRKKTQPLINLYLKNKRDNDPVYRLIINMRSRLKSYLKIKNINKKNRTFDLVGCAPEFLKEHLERQFKDNMNWDNYGLYGWHIDHIIPLSSAKTEEEIYKLCHYTNLQPLWAEENIKKSNKLIII
jgi:hypothetical protein